MAKLETVLLDAFLRGDPRILVLASFQEAPYTYVKVVVNDGKHDIIVEKIKEIEFALSKDETLNATIQSAIEKAADILIAQALLPVIVEFCRDPM